LVEGELGFIQWVFGFNALLWLSVVVYDPLIGMMLNWDLWSFYFVGVFPCEPS
jgi:hypothetical protein